VAQTVDWNPIHLHATLYHAFKHPGFSFVRILQRCPQYTANRFEEYQRNPDLTLFLTHEKGIASDDQSLQRMYKNQMVHDPLNMAEAMELAARTDVVPIGAFFVDPSRPRYEEYTTQGIGMTPQQKIAAFDEELDRFAV
jgi:2-oxoglutarate ferredoxin oxidoreductase subunit beta